MQRNLYVRGIRVFDGNKSYLYSRETIDFFFHCYYVCVTGIGLKLRREGYPAADHQDKKLLFSFMDANNPSRKKAKRLLFQIMTGEMLT